MFLRAFARELLIIFSAPFLFLRGSAVNLIFRGSAPPRAKPICQEYFRSLHHGK